MFIAVNSGSTPAEVTSYARQNDVTWPVIMDTDRGFESEVNVNKVSLSNIWQFRSIDADGNISRFNDTEIVPTVKSLLKKAEWNVDSALIPDTLSAAHRMIEFGFYSDAAGILADASTARDESVKTGAKALLDFVNQKIAARLKEANDAKSDGKLWDAFKLYSQTAERFRGYETEIDLRATLKELRAEESVKSEFSAQRQFENAKKQFDRNGVKRTLVKLKKIMDKYPDTEGAAMAAEAHAALAKR